MKKFRPYNAGYLLLYGLTLICIIEAVRSLSGLQVGGAAGTATSNPFMIWSLLLCVFAVIYVKQYIPTVVEINGNQMRIVRPVLVIPKPGAQRANFIMRQGDKDGKLIEHRFDLSQVRKYGYVEDLGMKPEDQSGASATTKLFPVHEVAFVLEDEKNYRLNTPIYSQKQREEIFVRVQEITKIAPTGALAQDIARHFVPVKVEKKRSAK